jgi:hypothetical protein
MGFSDKGGRCGGGGGGGCCFCVCFFDETARVGGTSPDFRLLCRGMLSESNLVALSLLQK